MKSHEYTHTHCGKHKCVFHSASALQLAYLFWMYLFCLCVTATSRGSCLATANQSAERGQSANAKSEFIIAKYQTSDLRHTWSICLENQSFGSKPQGEKGALEVETRPLWV